MSASILPFSAEFTIAGTERVAHQAAALRSLVAGRVMDGSAQHTIALRSVEEFAALPEGWAILCRGFRFTLSEKGWSSASGTGWATFRLQ